MDDVRLQRAWAVTLKTAVTNLRQQLGAASIMLDDAQDGLLADIEDMTDAVAGFDEAMKKARALVESWLPKFIYVSDFPELLGHQNLDRYVNHRGEDQTTKVSEENFAKLAKVADFDPAYLHKNLNDFETRGQILNRAGSLLPVKSVAYGKTDNSRCGSISTGHICRCSFLIPIRITRSKSILMNVVVVFGGSLHFTLRSRRTPKGGMQTAPSCFWMSPASICTPSRKKTF